MKIQPMHICFNVVPPGKTFEYKGNYYMKLERTAGSEFRSTPINAVSLRSGSEATFSLTSDFVVVRDDLINLPEKS
jgi:hypothetical protein